MKTLRSRPRFRRSPAVRADILEQVLVKVNGEIFTKTELEARQVVALRQKGEPMDLKGEAGAAQLRKALDDITPQIIVDVVDEMLLVQRGKELGYKLSDEQFKTAVDSIKKDNKIETEEQFQAALKQENMTMADLRRNFERQMIRSRVEQNEVLGKVGVTEDEARKYYQAHLNEFTSPPTITLREILVAVPADPKGDERRGGRRGEGEGGGDPRAGGRELREAGRRRVRRAVARQRRPHRADQRRRICRRNSRS